jgi:hypothetical protein
MVGEGRRAKRPAMKRTGENGRRTATASGESWSRQEQTADRSRMTATSAELKFADGAQQAVHVAVPTTESGLWEDEDAAGGEEDAARAWMMAATRPR